MPAIYCEFIALVRNLKQKYFIHLLSNRLKEQDLILAKYNGTVVIYKALTRKVAMCGSGLFTFCLQICVRMFF